MILGIDCGQTALKAVLFDGHGKELGLGRIATTVNRPQTYAAERDMLELSDQLDHVIREALTNANVAGSDVTAVGIVAHGDGIYPVDNNGDPTRPAFLALDGRSGPLLRHWESSGLLTEAVTLTGQQPHTGSQVAVAAWWKENEPETYAQTRWLLYCKDWLRFRLTGDIATDTVEASACVGARNGRSYDAAAMEKYGLPDLLERLPAIHEPTSVGGHVTAAAAARTGLMQGTPVAVGTHDVVASALGTGAIVPGDWCVQAGTYSVNQLIDVDRVADPRWQTRPWVVPGQWVAMGASPSSATNLDWFLRTLMGDVAEPLTVANSEVASVLGQPSSVMFHPYLSGSPFGPQASGSFVGLHDWHGRPHLLRALFEGVVMNHRFHLDALLERAPRQRVTLSGGVTHSLLWSQMFADVLNCEVIVTDATEHGALGAAMLAGVASGLWESVRDATESCIRTGRSYTPDPTRKSYYDELFTRFLLTVEAMQGLWPALEEELPQGVPSARPDAPARVDLLDHGTVLQYLAGRELINASQVSRAEVSPLDGGISNTVLAVEAPGCSWVVKQSLPQLRVAQQWLAKQERTLNEARGLRLASKLTPGFVPAVVDVDPDRFVLVLERAPGDCVPLKSQLMSGTVDLGVFVTLGNLLGQWHARTIANPSSLDDLDDPEAFDQLRVEPYHRAAAQALPHASADILAVVDRMVNRRIALVHGDFSPKNILTSPGPTGTGSGPWVLDFEVAHKGDPDFDVAFLLSHLMMKAVHLPRLSEEFERAATGFLTAYDSAVGHDPGWRSSADHVMTHTGALLLARTDGKSPAEYLNDAGRQVVRSAGLRLVKPKQLHCPLPAIAAHAWAALLPETQ